MLALRSSTVGRRGGGSIGKGSETTRGVSRSGERPGRRSLEGDAPFTRAAAAPGRTSFFLSATGRSLARCGLSLERRGRSTSAASCAALCSLSFSLSFGFSLSLVFSARTAVRSARAVTFRLASLGLVALTRMSLVFVVRERAAVALAFVALGFATLARVVALVRAVLAFAALALTLAPRVFATLALTLAAFALEARVLVALSLVARVALALAAAFLAFVAVDRLAAARVAFFALSVADFFRALVRVVLEGDRVVFRRVVVAAALRVVARLVAGLRRLAAFALEARRAAGRAAVALRFGLRAAGFALRARALAVARRAELAAFALVAFFRSFVEVFRVFFAAMGVLSHNRSGCPLP